MSDIIAATISDINNTVTTYPETIKSRALKDALFSFTTSGTSKESAEVANNTAKTVDGADYFFWSMRDEKGNFVGFACKESNDEIDYDRDSLLKDLLPLATVSALCKNDASIRPRVAKLLDQRVTASNETTVNNANESIEVMRRVLEKRVATAAAAASAAAAAAASSSKKSSPKKEKNKTAASIPKEIVSSEEAAAAAQLEEESCSNDSTTTKHHHHHCYHTEEFENQWKSFQNTTQYKASAALLGLSAIVSLAFMLCNPDLSACR